MATAVQQPAVSTAQQPDSFRIPLTWVWLLCCALCLLLYWYGFRAWFRADDFAWLSLHTQVHNFETLLDALFRPMAQGTIRPLSERLVFLAGWHLFGMEAPPFRALVFATQFANLGLVTAVSRRLTGSDRVATLAPALWLINPGVYLPLSWISAYNQVLCSFFVLAALYSLVRFTQEGGRRWLVLQWIAFLAGFGALELNVVYPAVAALYAICFSRRHVWQAMPLFAVSAAYVLLHDAFSPAVTPAVYGMHFDLELPVTFFRYLQSALGGSAYLDYRFGRFGLVLAFLIAEGVLGAALGGYLVGRQRPVALFAAGWFVLTLAPVLPLKNQFQYYYLFQPAIGLCLLGAVALTEAFASRRVLIRAGAAVLLLVYAIPSALMARGMTKEIFYDSRACAELVRRVAYIHYTHPEKRVLLAGVDSRLFWNAIRHEPWVSFGMKHVYLTQETESHVESQAGGEAISRFFLPDAAALEGIRRNELLVYEWKNGSLRNMTPVYRVLLESRPAMLPKYIDVNDPLFSYAIGRGWWQHEPQIRWMSSRASVFLRGPEQSGAELIVRGICSPARLEEGAVRVAVRLDGKISRTVTIDEDDLCQEFRIAVPEKLLGRDRVEVQLSVDRPLRVPGDARELGLAFGTIEFTR